MLVRSSPPALAADHDSGVLAGAGAPPVPIEELSVEQWGSVVGTNLTAPFLCTQHAFRMSGRWIFEPRTSVCLCGRTMC